jgi:hypothetical protein
MLLELERATRLMDPNSLNSKKWEPRRHREMFLGGSEKTIGALRVGYRCSNPNFCNPANGPQKDYTYRCAAHITAAAPDGPRLRKDRPAFITD